MSFNSNEIKARSSTIFPHICTSTREKLAVIPDTKFLKKGGMNFL